MKIFRYCLAVRLPSLILVFAAPFAWAQGPIDTRNHEAASLAFLRLEPRGGLLAPGERSLALDFSSANSLRFADGYREDQETERLGVRYRVGVGRGEWSVEVPFLSRGGGFQDPLIEAYHHLIGIDNFRDDVPYGREEEHIPGSGSFGSATGLGDVTVAYARPLGPQAFVSYAVKLPTGNAGELFGSGNADLAVSLYDRWKLGRHFGLFGQLGGVYQGHPSRLDYTRALVDQESLALEYRPDSRDGYVFQWQSEPSALITGVKTFDGPHRQLSLGWSRRLSGRDAIQIYFNEDGDFLNFRVPELVNIAPDFTFGINLVRKW